MKHANFLFHVSPDHFPGYIVTVPFYFGVYYCYEGSNFIRVENVEIPFTAIGRIYLGQKLADEIEAAAKSNLNSITPEMPYNNPNDIPDELFRQTQN